MNHYLKRLLKKLKKVAYPFWYSKLNQSFFKTLNHQNSSYPIRLTTVCHIDLRYGNACIARSTPVDGIAIGYMKDDLFGK